jgi:hypothetical protein
MLLEKIILRARHEHPVDVSTPIVHEADEQTPVLLAERA